MSRSAIGAVLVVALLSAAAPASAQAVAGDGLVSAWRGHHTAADVTSTIEVAASLTLDTWHSWHEPDRWHALSMQLARDGVTVLSTELTKRLVHRTRPDGSDALSFFSEHTALSASAIGGPRLVVALPLTFSTGYLRIAADKHYLTDTLVGAVVGGLSSHFLR